MIIQGIEVTPAPQNIPLNYLLDLWNMPNRIPCPCPGCRNGFHIIDTDLGWLLGAPTILRSAQKCEMCDEDGMVTYLSGN